MNTSKRPYSLRTRMLLLNLLVTVGSLLLCGTVFALSVFFVMEDYVNRDTDFFLAELCANLDSRTQSMITMVRNVLDDPTLAPYLQDEEVEEELAVQALRKAVDLSDLKNLTTGGVPLVEKAYLFSLKGRSISSTYFAMLYAQKNECDRLMQSLYERFIDERQTDYALYPTGERVYLLYALYSPSMERMGTLILELRQSAVDAVLSQVKRYQGAIALVFDQRQQELLYAYNQQLLSAQELNDLKQAWRYQPFQQQLAQGEYRCYALEMGMNLRVIIGIPVNQLSLLLNPSIKIYVLIIAMITLGTAILYFLIVYRLTKPLRDVVEKIKLVREGNFETKLPDYQMTEFHEMSEVFNEMTAHVSYLISQVYQKQLTVKEMELKLLQSRMDPHFMFNVLNTIALQAKIDQNEEVYRMISSFSHLVQTKIYRSNSETVRLGKELDYVGYYLYLQSYRYGDRLNYSISVEPEALKDCLIPKLSLQMLVENAIVHGIEPKALPCHVNVTARQTDDCLLVEVKDDGVGFNFDGVVELPLPQQSASDLNNHIGLNNIQQIIRLMYGESYGLTVLSRKDEGTTISMRLPIHQEEELP